MEKLTVGERENFSKICSSLDKTLSEEQMEFACDLTKPVISFANPGTGKTFTACAGIIMAQTFHKVPGARINAMSFTNMATMELKIRYDKMCKQCLISPTATFNTFHSICNKILKDSGMEFNIRKHSNYGTDIPRLIEYMKQYGLPEDPMYARKILDVIDKLGSAFVYDEAALQEDPSFVSLELSIGVFQKLRCSWFNMCKTVGTINQGDIPQYAYWLLNWNEKIAAKYKNKYDIMIIDEFQDLTSLHLLILSKISKNLVAIGDMKQQIYGFNGASQHIVDEFMRMYPNAKVANLTQSFRCKNEIADFATRIIAPNKVFDYDSFKGVSDGGAVEVIKYQDMDFATIVSHVKKEQEEAAYRDSIDTMFLYRNNISAIPIAEELYKQKVPFRMNRFSKVMDMPIFKHLCMYADLANNPRNSSFWSYIPELFPEFRKTNVANCPFIKVLYKTGTDIFNCPYNFKEQSSTIILATLLQVKSLIQKFSNANVVLSKCLPLYEEYVLQNKWYLLEYPKEHYFDIASPVLNSKSYQELVASECDKEKHIKECYEANTGVRCYTVHSAKGLEADEVYILDCNDGILPNSKALSRTCKVGCEYAAAKDVRSDRNLLYVAITRAKTKCIIAYDSLLSELVSSPLNNKFSIYDDIFVKKDRVFNNGVAFKELFGMELDFFDKGIDIVVHDNSTVCPEEAVISKPTDVVKLTTDYDNGLSALGSFIMEDLLL